MAGLRGKAIDHIADSPIACGDTGISVLRTPDAVGLPLAYNLDIY
jgi:hypothetical protein